MVRLNFPAALFMSQIPFDQLSKQYLEEFPSPLLNETRSRTNALLIEQPESLADALLDFSASTDFERWLANDTNR